MSKSIVLIIGAPKAGTTVLAQMIEEAAVEYVYPYGLKESHCLLGKDIFESLGSENNFSKSEYSRILNSGQRVLDASTGYAHFWKWTAESLSCFNKRDILIIYCIRDPIQRAISEYRQLQLHRNVSLEELEKGAINNLNEKHHFGRFKENSDYLKVIEGLRVSEYDHIIVRFEDLLSKPESISRMLETYGIYSDCDVSRFSMQNHRNRSRLYLNVTRLLPKSLVAVLPVKFKRRLQLLIAQMLSKKLPKVVDDSQYKDLKKNYDKL